MVVKMPGFSGIPALWQYIYKKYPCQKALPNQSEHPSAARFFPAQTADGTHHWQHKVHPPPNMLKLPPLHIRHIAIPRKASVESPRTAYSDACAFPNRVFYLLGKFLLASSSHSSYRNKLLRDPCAGRHAHLRGLFFAGIAETRSIMHIQGERQSPYK